MKQITAKTYSYKRIVQVMLFALLPIIDVVRNAGNGWQMMVASQTTGLVLAGVIVLHYGVKKFLKWYNLLWLAVAGIAIWSMQYWFYEEAIKYYYVYEMRMAFVHFAFFGMIVTHLIMDYKSRGVRQKELRPKNIWLIGLWFLYILMATIMKDNTYRPEFDLLYFGILYLVPFEKEELQQILRDLINGILIGFSAVQGVAFFFRHYVDKLNRYSGMYYNCNMFDLMCLVVMVAVLIKITEARKNKTAKHWTYWFWVMYYGVVFSLLILSVGRISIILAIGGTFVYLVLDKWKEEKKILRFMASSGTLFLATCIALPLTFAGVSYLPRIINRPIIYHDEYLKIGDVTDKENYISFGELMEGTLGRFRKIWSDSPQIQDAKGTEGELAEIKDKEEKVPLDPEWETRTYYLDENGYNAIELRLAIGRTYIDRLNLWGHTIDEWLMWVTPYTQFAHAHNIIIMQMYVYGIITGILFLVWIVGYAIAAFRYWRQNVRTDYALFPLMIVTLVLTFGMVEICWMSGQITWILLMLLQKCLQMRADDKEEKQCLE